MDMTSFGEVLAELRTQKLSATGKPLTQGELAELVGFSRGYLSLLESQESKRPSYSKLQALCRAVATVGADLESSALIRAVEEPMHVDPEKLSRLVSAALGLVVTMPGLADDRGPLHSEKAASGEQRWIFTDILAENVDDRFLARAAEEICAGVTYNYFVYEAQEWDQLAGRLQDALQSHASAQHVRAIECRSLLCLMRLSLQTDTSGELREGTITIGGVNAPRLKRLQMNQASEILTRAQILVKQLLMQGARTHVDPNFGKVTLLFPRGNVHE